jgi:putative membrane protein
MMWGFPGPTSSGPTGMMSWMYASALVLTLVWIALAALAIWAVFRLARSHSAPASMPGSGLPAMEILRQRYARGEIDAATFAQMRAVLIGDSPRERGQPGEIANNGGGATRAGTS